MLNVNEKSLIIYNYHIISNNFIKYIKIIFKWIILFIKKVKIKKYKSL